jgi:hypothetical protein
MYVAAEAVELGYNYGAPTTARVLERGVVGAP